MTITYWLQRADSASEERGMIGRNDAERLIADHKWPSEFRYKKKLEKAGEKTCDPGIGFVSEDKRILHVCPQASGRVLCHYHYDDTWRLLWLFPLRDQAQAYWFEESLEDAVGVVSKFFANDHKWLKQRSETESKAFDQAA